MSSTIEITKKIKTLISAFGLAGAVLGPVISVSTMFWPEFPSQDFYIKLGLAIFLVGGAITIFRHEFLLEEVDVLVGNKYLKKLWAMAITPTRDEYLRQIRSGKLDIVRIFWLAEIFNIQGANERSDLHEACQHGHAKIVEGLLERGANPLQLDGLGYTPLILATADGKLNVVNKLLDYGDCAIDTKFSDQGCSALFIASVHGRTSIVKSLIEHGADINTVDFDNKTPLMVAISRKKWDVAKFLLEAGADLSAINSSRATLMDYTNAFNAPDYIKNEVKKSGIKESEPKLTWSGNSSFSYPGKVVVSWNKK